MARVSNLLARRVGAYLIDVVLLFAVLAPIGFVAQRLLGVEPTTGPQIWRTLLVGFSLPTWSYLTACDASVGGATLGKRWLGIRVVRADGERVGIGRALVRTAIKLAPWELVHLAAFGLAVDRDTFTAVQGIGLGLANVLALAWLAAAFVTRGRRGVHDMIAGTLVQHADAAVVSAR